MSGIAESEIGPAERQLPQEAAYLDDRDRRGATGLANGLAISLALWALMAFVASLVFH